MYICMYISSHEDVHQVKISWAMLLAGNFQAEENVHEFQGFVTICECFLCKIWRYDIINMFFPRKSYFPPICILANVSCYTAYACG